MAPFRKGDVSSYFDSLPSSRKSKKCKNPFHRSVKPAKPRKVVVSDLALRQGSDSTDPADKERLIEAHNVSNIEHKEERDSRTIFINNFPYKNNKKKVAKYFQEFGIVESVRYRSLPGPRNSGNKLEIFKCLKGKHVKSAPLFVVFKLPASARAAATSVNGRTLNGRILQADMANKKPGCGEGHSVFIGNLSFDVTEDELWDHFKSCGAIKRARVIMDRKSLKGKGFGYVNFMSKDSVVLALKLNGSELKGREIRVSKYTLRTPPNIAPASTSASP